MLEDIIMLYQKMIKQELSGCLSGGNREKNGIYAM